MKRISVDLNVAGLRSKVVNDYVNGHPDLKPFYNYSPNWNSFSNAIEDRKGFKVNRNLLVSELTIQHQEYFQTYPKLVENIELLKSDSTFTVTTGHQLCVVGGPLFFLYKIITTINLAKGLKQRYPEYNFVPVYWMASEDHDFEEISSIFLFNKTLKWEQAIKGATGRIPTASLPPFLDELIALIGEGNNAEELIKILRDAYYREGSLSEATRHFVLSLFGEDGLLVLDADRRNLKSSFNDVLKDELLNQPSFKLVSDTNEKLSENYKVQVIPRALNLFYLDNELRERLVQAPDEHFEVVNTELAFRKQILLDILEQKPEFFSPNVVLRPVYQEFVLPNLAYVGGPGEIAYWLELKTVFDHHHVFYPMLVSRNHALILNEKTYTKFTQLGFKLEDIFKEEQTLVTDFVATLDESKLNIVEEKEQIAAIYSAIQSRFNSVDPTLSGAVAAEQQKAMNGLDNLDKKLVGALKRRNETALSQIKNLSLAVNPNRKPQERELNFIPFYLRSGKAFIQDLKDNFEPFDNSLSLLIEN
jgi:bacillithiol biosynthesis cysteine-adding enzyme BshC